ncbi:MAG: sulfotransferase [bacterium]|nr:sulfotransferase [bacterium]
MSCSFEFFVAGASMSGAEILCERLAGHPDVYLPESQDESCLLAESDEESAAGLQVLLDRARTESARGLACRALASRGGEEARETVSRRHPGARVILVVRDPIDRAESVYRERHTIGTDDGIQCPFDLGAALRRFPGLVEGSAYASISESLRRCFGADQIHVVLREELCADPAQVVAGCLAFLGVGAAAGSDSGQPDAVPIVESPMYYDSDRLRSMRDAKQHPELAASLALLTVEIQDQFLPELGLRLRFGDEACVWQSEDEAYVVEALHQEIERFLSWIGRPPECWPRFAAARRACGYGE